MSDDPLGFSPEIREFAKAVLALVEPLLRTASAPRLADDGKPGTCQQVWCPVCAAVAVVTGEPHPLISRATEHADSILTLFRAMVDSPASDSADDESAAEPTGGPGHYEPIEVVVLASTVATEFGPDTKGG